MIGYRPDIDGLRAIAILTVVACHVGVGGWSGGYVGVDVFFVISGYLITSLLVAEAKQHQRIDLWGFYARRVRRLLPALLTVVLGALLLGLIFLVSVDGEQQGLARSAVAALLFNANHYYWWTTGGYFDTPTALLPLLHLWSLSVEEQFYLIWPLGLIGLLGRRSAHGFEPRVRVVLSVVVVVSFAFAIWLVSRNQSAAFYLMPARAWALALGAIVAVMPSPARAKDQSFIGAALGFAGLGAIAVAVTAYDRTTVFPGTAALLPALGAVAVIVGNGLAPKGLPSRALSWKPMVIIGLVSYSWYLWHWPLLAIARSVRLGDTDLWRDGVLAGVLGFGLACATYRWIESPIRWSSKARSYGARAAVSIGLLATVTCTLFASGLGAWAKFSPKSPTELRMIAARADLPPLQRVCFNLMEQSPRLPSSDQCLEPKGSTKVDIVLWGDSHADHWMPAFAGLATEEGVPTQELTRSNCPPTLPGLLGKLADPIQKGRCVAFQQMSIDEIDRLRLERGLKGVILSAAWYVYPVGEIGAALSATLDHFESLGLKVLIIAPTPWLRYHAPDCLLRHEESFCAMPRADLETYLEPAYREIKRVATGRKFVKIFDPVPLVCDEVMCMAVRHGKILYTDNSHLSATVSRAFADFVRQDFLWLRAISP